MALPHSRRPSMAGFRGVRRTNHHPGDSFGGQNRYESSPNILQCIFGNATQKGGEKEMVMPAVACC